MSAVLNNSDFPEIEILYEPNQAGYCIDQELILTAYADDAVYYKWNVGDDNEPVIDVTSAEVGKFEYSILVENSLGCQSTKVIELDFFDCNLGNGIHSLLYPNPTTGKFILELVKAAKDYEILVYDFRGRRVVEKKIINNSDTVLKIDFDLSDYERGVYMIVIKVGDKQKVERVVVQ